MAWTDPRTWATGELVTAALLNTHLRDNLNYLLSPNNDFIKHVNGSDYTTSSTSFGDVDATNLRLSITSNGGLWIVGFSCACSRGTSSGLAITLDDGGTNLGDANAGLATHDGNGTNSFASGIFVGTLAAGAHDIDLQFRALSASTVTIFATTEVVVMFAAEI